jgi:hypothetical protein
MASWYLADWEVPANATSREPLAFQDDDSGLPDNFTGATFKIEARNASNTVVATFISPTGIELTDLANGKITLVCPPAVAAVGTYDYDLIMTIAAVKTKLMEGKFIVVKGITA